MRKQPERSVLKGEWLQTIMGGKKLDEWTTVPSEGIGHVTP